MKKLLLIALLLIFALISCEEGEEYEPRGKIILWDVDGNSWSGKSTNEMNWKDAMNYCKHIDSDLRLPSINEIRTLIENCSGSQTGGTCPISDPNNLSKNDWNGDCYCESKENDASNYSKLGDNVILWSSSTESEDRNNAWGVDFGNGHIDDYNKSTKHYVRCIQKY